MDVIKKIVAECRERPWLIGLAIIAVIILF